VSSVGGVPAGNDSAGKKRKASRRLSHPLTREPFLDHQGGDPAKIDRIGNRINPNEQMQSNSKKQRKRRALCSLLKENKIFEASRPVSRVHAKTKNCRIIDCMID
jgi:hypothetical protein